MELKIELDDNELLKVPFRNDFQGKMRTRSVITIGGLVIPNPGSLKFNLGNGVEISSYKIIVNRIGEPKAEVKAE
jgi:hypothetical protein